MSKQISYSILTYKHSLFLGEVLNVGVLFVFPDENLVEFHYPKKLNRLKGVYTDFNETLIKDYLKAFELTSRKLSKEFEPSIFGYNNLISENFLIEDASALQFENFRTGIYYSPLEQVREQYIKLLLGHYESETISTVHKTTEESIVKTVKNEVLALNPKSKDLLKFDANRILKSKHVAFNSDFYWKNKVIHYAKAVSFDVAKESTIIDKALLLNGKLRQLEKTKYKNSHIDFLIHEPKKIAFQDVIEEAKAILQDNEIHQELYLDLSLYSKEVADHIKE